VIFADLASRYEKTQVGTGDWYITDLSTGDVSILYEIKQFFFDEMILL